VVLDWVVGVVELYEFVCVWVWFCATATLTRTATIMANASTAMICLMWLLPLGHACDP
jgi:hypothetical protein